MKNPGIKITWKEVKRKIPDYNKFSIEKQKEIKNISNTIIYTRFLINGIKEINANYKKVKSAVKDFPAFGLMQRAFYFQVMVEMNKLFDNNESLCISKYINELVNNYRRIVWFNNLLVEELREMQLNIENHKEYFEKIKNIRDEHLAHSDKNRKKISVHIDELDTLQKLVEDISNKIGNALYGTSTGYDHHGNGSLNGIFNRLTAFDQLRDMIFEANKNIKDSISTDKLLDIVRFKSVN